MPATTKTLYATTLLSDAPRPQLVRTPRGAVECVITGEGPAVLALHGAMGGWDQSLLLARTVGAPGFRTLAISRPGYLGTSLSTGRTPAEQADLYCDLLDALGVDRAAVMAVSGGGPSALELARRHGDRCWGAVIVSSVCRRNPVRLPLAWHVMKLAARIGPLTDRMRRKVVADPEGAAQRSILDPALRARTVRDPEAGPLLHALQISTAERMAARLPGTENDVLTTTQQELLLPLEQIAVPTLIVHGTVDRVAPFAQGQEMARRIPGAELLALEGGDHVAIFTHRAEAKARVTRFLREHAPAAR